MAMNRRRNLITSPLEWFLSANPVPPPAIPVLAERGGTQLKTPRPVLVVDTREQNPFLAGPAAEALGDVAPAVAEGLSKTGGAVKAAAKAGGPDILAGTAKVGAAEIDRKSTR